MIDWCLLLPAACSLRGVRRKVKVGPGALPRKEMLLALLDIDRCALRLRVFSISYKYKNRIIHGEWYRIVENSRRNWISSLMRLHPPSIYQLIVSAPGAWKGRCLALLKDMLPPYQSRQSQAQAAIDLERKGGRKVESWVFNPSRRPPFKPIGLIAYASFLAFHLSGKKRSSKYNTRREVAASTGLFYYLHQALLQ